MDGAIWGRGGRRVKGEAVIFDCRLLNVDLAVSICSVHTA